MKSEASEIQLAAIRRGPAGVSLANWTAILLVNRDRLAHNNSSREYLPVDRRHSSHLILKAVDRRDAPAHLIPCGRRFDGFAQRVGQAFSIADSEMDAV